MHHTAHNRPTSSILLCHDVQDAKKGVWLPVTLESLISVSALLFEDEDLGGEGLFLDLSQDLDICEQRLSNGRK